MPTGKEDPRDWDVLDRNERVASGELTEEIVEDPTEVILGEDD